ncbi:MAG: hypothetical protein OXL97_08470 [Chloroflexota bacterium]|nr:hypothetical protein [Chloroflexota bacterium]MDE2883828.1 hypothetical protein [Chloroflexota bacterium]
MKDKQLDAASFFGRVATFLFIGFLAERVGTTYLGAAWGAVFAIGVMLAMLVAAVLWTRWKSRR